MANQTTYRVPSLKSLCDAFPQSEPDALAKFREIARRKPWRIAAQEADKAIEGYGVEVIRCPSRGLQAVYVNTGDAYTETLLCNVATGAWRITTWGDFVESFERRHGRAASENLSCY